MTKANYESSVFINCPFDDAYEPLFQALVFTIHDCGFVARCALEASDASELRVKKIYELIQASKFGVHDLSRVGLDEKTQLPRFNMPLELGIFLGAKFLGNPKQRQKACLVFDEQPYRYQMYLSDIAGQDISTHQNDVKKLIGCTRNWLAAQTLSNLHGGEAIFSRFKRFLTELESLCLADERTVDEIPFPDFVRYVSAFVTEKSDVMRTGQKMRWGGDLSNPSLSHIREAIKELKGKQDSFVILSKGGTGRTYMQVSGGKRDGYQLEHQAGSEHRHFRCMSEDLNEGQVIDAFQQFRSGSDGWLDQLIWEPHRWWAAEHG